jgi:hypothetical protein
MIKFDESKPLVYLHLFKTAGSTIANFFEHWFKGPNLLNPNGRYQPHHDHATKRVIRCSQENIDRLKTYNVYNPVFFGHFDMTGNFKFPPDCNQFITMLRDPFDIEVSAFYFRTAVLKDKLTPHINNIEDYILNSDYHYKFTNVFTKEELTLENYQEVINKYFVMIGSMKNYNKSLELLQSNLDLKIPEKLLNLKINERAKVDNFLSPDYLRELHREKWPLEYAIYDYINNLYEY